MKKQHSSQTGRAVVVSGDEQLTQELIPLLEDKGFTVLQAHDKHAIKSAGASIVAGFELTMADGVEKKEALQLLDACLPSSAVLISTSVFISATRQSSWITHRERLIGICAFPTLMNGPMVETAVPVQTKASVVTAATELFAELGKELVSVQDRVGMIFPGILSQVINEALFAVQQNVASPEDIDTGMKAGAGYPMGPIEWGEKIGFAVVVQLLDAMRAESGEERYKVAPLLRQLSLSGKFWTEKIITPEPVQEVLQLDDVPALDTAVPAEDPAQDAAAPKPARAVKHKKKPADKKSQ
jgi:3-hydroxybutyryl-CoA dehydrogenase